MAEIRPYKKEYFSRRKKVVSFVFLALFAVAATGLAFWYFASRADNPDAYAGKVVSISGSLEDVGLVKTFREGKSISYYSAASGFRDLVYRRLEGDYAIRILARDVASFLAGKIKESRENAARRQAGAGADAASPLPPPVNVVPGDDGAVADAPVMDKEPAGAEMPAGPQGEVPREDDDPAPGYARTREQGVREYDREVGEMAVQADEIDSLWQKYNDFCQGTIAATVGNAYGREWFGIYTTINAADTPECRMMIQDMQNLAAAIDAGMEAAWEKAHRAGVYPGQVRAVQQRYRMELDRWNK